MRSGDINEMIEEMCENFIGICPHCGAKAHLEMNYQGYFLDRARHQHNYIIFRCKPCGSLLVKEFLAKQNPYIKEQKLDLDGWVGEYPSIGCHPEQKFIEFVPSSVIEDYAEGLKCMSVGAYRAGVSMFRRAVQDSMVNLGADQDCDLIDQIKSVSSLTQELKDWAHNVRIFGNWGAHPQKDILNDVTEDLANEVRDFIEEFMNYTYVMPGKVAKSREKYTKKNSKKS